MRRSSKSVRDHKDLSRHADSSQKMARQSSEELFQCYYFRSPPQKTHASPSRTIRMKSPKSKQGRTPSQRMKSTAVEYNLGCSKMPADENNQIRVLREENAQLKQQIIQLKVCHFYKVDDEKLKAMVRSIEELNSEIDKLKKDNQQLRLENDFLSRANHQLKRLSNSITMGDYDKNKGTRQERELSKRSRNNYQSGMSTSISKQLSSDKPRQDKFSQNYGPLLQIKSAKTLHLIRKPYQGPDHHSGNNGQQAQCAPSAAPQKKRAPRKSQSENPENATLPQFSKNLHH